MVPLVVPVGIDLGPALAARALGVTAVAGAPGAAAASADLLERDVPRLRDELFLDLGVALPGVRARTAPDLEPDAYIVSLQEIPVARGAAPLDRCIALAAPSVVASFGVGGEEITDAVTGGTITLVPPEARAVLEAAGVAVLDESASIARHAGHLVRRRAHDLVGLQEVQTMLDQLERAYPALVRNVVPKPVTLALLADVLRRLVEEGVSIRPLREILEALAIYAPAERDPVALTELARSALRRHITHRYARGASLSVYLLDPAIEAAVRDAIHRTPTGSYLALAPDMARDIVSAVRRETAPGASPPVLLTQMDVRRFVRRLLEVDLPGIVVLSYQELAPEVTVQPLGRIAL